MERPGDAEPDIDVAFSPGGKVLAALATGDGIIHRWSLSRLRHVTALGDLFGAPSGLISVGPRGLTVADTADGQSAGQPSQTAIWDLRGLRPGRPLASLAQTIGHPAVTALDPAAPVLATGGTTGIVRLWDMSRPGHLRLLATMTGTTAPQNALAFSPDGRMLASSDSNSSIHIWDVANPRDPVAIGAFTAPQAYSLLGISLPVKAAGGPLAATITNNDAVSLWDTSASALIGRLCGSAGTSITAPQWRQYVPGQPYRPPCRARR
jgi:WD40 repeat protein